ncbi:MAG: N-acetyl-gamma-glutamyl-phosphate reductase [Robiginitalea sp.]|uniref:N-acetyl-gamma-glutamyl-phosphate reductase n=1 Tax=Robiginitalea sp. TaxID=1902411 RepID=UPI003C735489
MIRAGVIGGSGYTGGELIRLLLHHPEVHLDFVFSRTRRGESLYRTFPDLLGQTNLTYVDRPNAEADVVFLCLGHGNSGRFLEEWSFGTDTRIVDLSNEFRALENRWFGEREFIYGLPECHADAIAKAQNIANPGCFATAIELALLPLAAAGLLKETVHINAVTGSTGAGAGLSETAHFSWRNNNMSVYKPFTHQHLGEIQETLEKAGAVDPELYFLPHRGNFPRGIFATLYTAYAGSLEQAIDLYTAYYENAPFTFVTEVPVNLKQVINTNAAHLHLHLHQGKLLITSVLDNLLKGASGQAVENMNLMFGIPRETGLTLKAIGF